MQVLGESVIVIARCWLAGLAKPSPVIGDYTVTRRQKRRDLLLPGSSAQWIAVDKDNWVTQTMILIIKIDVTRVFFTDINVWH